MFKKIAKKLIDGLNYKEYKNPPFGSFNERPVEYRFVFEQISKYYPKTILDVGTGVTALPHLMANCGCAVTAIDNVKDYWTSSMFNRHFYIINDDITNTKLTAQFDLITCISTLEHIERCDQAVKNMFRLLKADGHLVLSFPYNEKRGVSNVYTLPEAKVKKVPSYPARAYCREDLKRWQQENNSRIIAQEYWQFFPGEYWTAGEMILPPKKVSKEEKHHISCVLFQK